MITLVVAGLFKTALRSLSYSRALNSGSSHSVSRSARYG